MNMKTLVLVTILQTFAFSLNSKAGEPSPILNCVDGVDDGGKSFVVFKDDFEAHYARLIQHDQIEGDQIMAEFLGVRVTPSKLNHGVVVTKYTASAHGNHQSFNLTVTSKNSVVGIGLLSIVTDGRVLNLKLRCENL